MMRGDYRRTRLQTPTLVLFGTANPAFPPELVNLLMRDREAYADHVEVAFRPWCLTLHRRREAGCGGGSRPQVLPRAGASGLLALMWESETSVM